MRRAIILMIFSVLTFGLAFADDADKAVGIWKSVSDVKGEEGKVTAYWKITVEKDVLTGVIIHVPGQADSSVYNCKKAEFNGKPVVGTPWIRNMKKTGSANWGGGTIVDVGSDKGDVYGCEMNVTRGGKVLEMRGFMGISLLGRTQYWQASSEAELKAAQDTTSATLAKK